METEGDALEELLNIETEIEDVQDQIKFLLERQEKLHERQSELKYLLEAYKASGTGNSANENASRSSSLEDWSGSFEWDSQADDVRLNIFGIPSYRQNQKEIINAIMSGRDVLVIMAAGGGKSLCYQLPAILRDGVALVISPLLSLIQDQVMGLTALGIPAYMLTSTTSKENEKFIYKALEKGEGELKILYVTPEKISKSKRFMSKLEKCHNAGRLSLISIDLPACWLTYKVHHQKRDTERKEESDMHPHGPRSTGRRRKRLTRMDAAVDAMRSYGFSDGLTVSTVKGLLNVYGEEGWPFIEESSYKVLLEAILEDLEKEEQEKSNKLQENERCGNSIEISAGSTSNGVSVSTGHSTEAVAPASQPDETLLTISQAANLDIALLDGTPASKAGSSWTDINMDENCIEKQINSDNRGGVMNFGGAQLPGNISSPTQPTHCAPPCRRRPCYGWISSDEDDDVDVIELTPAPLPAVVAKLLSGIDAPRTRKRRWDVRPEDM